MYRAQDHENGGAPVAVKLYDGASFNWLSFRGDDRLDFRDERGYYVGLEKQIDELFDSYRQRFPD